MTQPEELAVIKTLTDERDKIRADYESLQSKHEDLKSKMSDVVDMYDKRSHDLSYYKGVIDGLAFSTRCNGVSGNDVEPVDLPWD